MSSSEQEESARLLLMTLRIYQCWFGGFRLSLLVDYYFSVKRAATIEVKAAHLNYNTATCESRALETTRAAQEALKQMQSTKFTEIGVSSLLLEGNIPSN